MTALSLPRVLLWVMILLAAGACERSGAPASSEGLATARQATIVPTGFIDELVVPGFTNATAMEFAPDGRLFVSEQGGTLWVVKNGVRLSAPFVTVSTDNAGERGLLGIAFHPSFATTSWVYVYYTTRASPPYNRVSRFTASGDVAVGGEQAIVNLDPLSGATNHNGGAIHFAPGATGKLFIAVGDNAYGANAQSFNTRLGKMLRVNDDGTIPSDNPFLSSTAGNNQMIWAMGLRNPFTFAVHPSTGQLYINDVGQNTWEEINAGRPAGNYGWPTTEGDHSDARYDRPLHAYPHGSSEGQGCSIAGGAFYAPAVSNFPSSHVGEYFFADFCTGWIRRYSPSTGTVTPFAQQASWPVDLKVGPDGALYYLARGTGGPNAGSVRRIRFASTTQAPTITQQPSNQTVAAGQAMTVSVAASGTPAPSYQWLRNQAPISGATANQYTLFGVTTADHGARFSVRVSNAVGTVTSNEATLTVVNQTAPTVSITQPTGSATYAAGEVIAYAADASDAEDGVLPASAFTWRVDFHHDTHLHPFMASTSGAKSGAFTTATAGETAVNVWYRIHVTVTDSSGLTGQAQFDVQPRVSNLSLQTVPAGLQLSIDGQPTSTPVQIQSVVGMVRTVGAIAQSQGGVSYAFQSWSDGGAATHSLATPASPITLTATFTSQAPQPTTSGLKGEYFNGIAFQTLQVTRTDPTVDFNWGLATPDPAVSADLFSVRWSGQLLAPTTGSYLVHTVSDDGVRLWVNGQLVIDRWSDHSATEDQASVSLVAGQSYPLRMEFYDNARSATARLLWTPPGGSKVVIPSTALSTTGAPPVQPPSGLLTIKSVSTLKAYGKVAAAAGVALYIDRGYSLSTFSPVLAGGELVQTANDDKNVNNPNHLTVGLSKNATLYVAFDSRATTVPAWLNDGTWTLTSLTFVGTDTGSPTLARRVYSKDVVAGDQVLGGNAAYGVGPITSSSRSPAEGQPAHLHWQSDFERFG